MKSCEGGWLRLGAGLQEWGISNAERVICDAWKLDVCEVEECVEG